jgi:hypothetical protein
MFAAMALLVLLGVKAHVAIRALSPGPKWPIPHFLSLPSERESKEVAH